jgi:hypothetical protein
MSPWKLEALRLWRTRRLVALAGAFAILGLGIPILTYELPSLIKNGTGGIQVTVPRQTPADSLVSFGSNAVVALWASIARSVLAVVGTSLASILALAFLSDIHPLHTWLPSALGASVADLVGPHHPGVPWAAVAISAAATVALVGTAVMRLSWRPGPGG